MIRHLVSLAAVLFAAAASAQGTTPVQNGGQGTRIAQTQPPVTGPAAGPEVVLVRVAGPWQADGQRGFSRLVGTAAADGVTLIVEWISDAGELVRSTPLAAPSGSQNLALARVHGETGANDSIVYFDTGDDTFVLTVGAPGEAKFGPATN